MAIHPQSSPVSPFAAKGSHWLFAVLLLLTCWPVLVFQSHFFQDDTPSYFRGGGIIWQTAASVLPNWNDQTQQAPGPENSQASLSTDDSGRSTVGRSFTYSAGLFALARTLSIAAIPFVQAAFTLVFIFALIPPGAWHNRTGLFTGLIAMATLGTLPWFAVTLVPDIFAAVVILYGAILLERFDTLGRGWKIILAVLATLAVSFHYGYPPLMAGLAVIVFGWRLIRGRLTLAFVIAAALPVILPPVSNIAASSVVLGNASATPLRLPILLARSLEDGPAYWYLQTACPEADLAVCELFGEDMPRHVGTFLWDADGIKKLTADEMARVRDEEFLVLWRSFKTYPVQQSWSLIRNAATQLVRIGTSALKATPEFDENFQPAATTADNMASQAIRAFDSVTLWVSYLAAFALVVLWARGMLPNSILGPAIVVLAGIVLNAAIFGGLSAPVERYQSRVVWLLLLLVAISLGFYRRRNT